MDYPEKIRDQRVGAIIANIIVSILFLATPFMVALFMVILFALPFWPSLGLAYFVGLLVRSRTPMKLASYELKHMKLLDGQAK